MMLNIMILGTIALDLIGELQNNALRLMKPVPIFLMILYINIKNSKRDHQMPDIIGKGLALSLIGDILLMFNDQECFKIGTGFFLLAHLLYCYAFQMGDKIKKRTNTVKIMSCLGTVVVICIFGANMYTVWNVLPDRIFFPLYGLIVSFMAINSIFRYDRTTSYSFILIMIGSLLFGMSDNLLGFLKFNKISTDIGRFFIMLMYYFGQYFLMHGAMCHSNLVNSIEQTLNKHKKKQ